MDYLDCLAQTLSRWSENIVVVREKQCTIMRVVSRSSFCSACLNYVSARSAHSSPAQPGFTVWGGKKKNHLHPLCWLINFRFSVLIPYHAHVAISTYVIHFYISHGSSFEDRNQKKNWIAKSASAFSGWRDWLQVAWSPLVSLRPQEPVVSVPALCKGGGVL